MAATRTSFATAQAMHVRTPCRTASGVMYFSAPSVTRIETMRACGNTPTVP